MPFYMNPFDQEFRGNLILGDRQYSYTYVVPANKNNSEWQQAWNYQPYDFSSLSSLTFNISHGNNKIWGNFAVTVSGATPSATTAEEVVTDLNADTTFATYFQAQARTTKQGTTVLIRSLRDRADFEFYISNSGAESKLRFNKKAGIAEIPTYFGRHTIANGSYFSDESAVGMLIALDGTDTSIDRPIIREFLGNSAWTNSDLKADWQLLRGRSGIFIFRKTTPDGSNRPSVTIEYHAGAAVGDLAKRITYTYDGSSNTVVNYTEAPYILQSGDLINPV